MESQRVTVQPGNTLKRQRSIVMFNLFRFGVCCLFVVKEESEDEISQNCTYIQNPDFPMATSEATSTTYTINKCSNKVCSIRLDFEAFSISGMGGTEADLEANVNCGIDSFTVTVFNLYTTQV